MPKLHITKRAVDALEVSDKQVRYYDDKLTGFGVCVGSSGKKTFFIEYGPRNQRRRMTIGTYNPMTIEQAKDIADAKLQCAAKGNDPLEAKAKERAMPTLRRWFDEYMADKEHQSKRPDQYRYYVRFGLDAFGNRPLDKITKSDVQTVMRALAKRGNTNVTANRFLAYTRACFNEAIEAGHITSNPTNGIKKYSEPDARSRIFSDDEMKRLLIAIESEPDIYAKSAIQMMIETGARKTEVLSAEWKDIDFDSGWWTIPRSKAKAGKSQTIPLAKSTLALLRLVPHLDDSPWVFPGRDTAHHRDDIKKQWQRIRKEAQLTNVRIHDLRRTFGLKVAKEAGLHMASKLLRHSDVRVTERVYAPLGIDDMREALEKTHAKIIPMNKKEA
jgi:integrase